VKKLFTTSTMLPTPVHVGNRWLAVIGAADWFPRSRYVTPRPTRIAPGISVPINVPPEASLATSAIPREDTRTPPQNRTMMTAL
jgi:hypothetical protein